MSSPPTAVLRKFLSIIFVLVLTGVMYLAAQLPRASAEDRTALAGRFAFTELAVRLPSGAGERTVRQVNPRYEHIRAWISAVGAAIAVNDLDGQAVANDLCVVDTRTDSVIVTAAPGGELGYEPFVLHPAPLPSDSTMAPMGCVPGDFNEDGWNDLLVYYWGRTPVVFLNRGLPGPLSAASFVPSELMPAGSGTPGRYHGKLWNTNAVAVADFDGDSHVDIAVFNYFPDSRVLDPTGLPDVVMNHSMSRATNGGGAHVLRWTGATAASVAYEEQPDAIDPSYATGWTLGAGSADLDGDLLPELYVANDFGQDRFFRNTSAPGRIRFQLVEGRRGPLTPKSLVVGHDSFKSMSMEFGDLLGTGKFDMFISNITSSWGLEESNFVWINNATSTADAAMKLRQGIAPFDARAAKLNMAWVGWGWDAKMADFDNSGQVAVVQACGFLKGDINRFNWLHELAMANDTLLSQPEMWPKAQPGDDIAGSEPLAFWVREDNGRFVNLSRELRLDAPIPSRGVAVGDTDGDGAQDFAIARQWAAPVFYRNANSGRDNFLGLRLYRPAAGAAIGTPAYGAQVQITTADGRSRIAQVDGGSGHSGKRSFDIFFGLGEAAGQPVSAEVRWRDRAGTVYRQTLHLAPGWHNLMLTDRAQKWERP